jgi:hypothetical protein
MLRTDHAYVPRRYESLSNTFRARQKVRNSIEDSFRNNQVHQSVLYDKPEGINTPLLRDLSRREAAENGQKCPTK